MSDELFYRIKEGDKLAFELLYRTYSERMCLFASRFLCDREQAAEIVHDVFLNIWNNRQKLDLKNIYQSYLFTSTRNRCFTALEKEKTRTKFSEVIRAAYQDDDDIDSSDSLVAKEMENEIARSIEKLPPKCREVFLLSRYEKKKNGEIAKTLGVTEKAVEANITRALKELRKDLSEYLTIVFLGIF